MSVNYRHTGKEAHNIQIYTSIFLHMISLSTITLEQEEAVPHITEALGSNLGLKINCLD